MTSHVLAYHSHHVVSNDYSQNDHVALRSDLQLIDDAGYRIVPLAKLVDSAFCEVRMDETDERPLVAITFDDGPIYDAQDFTHPQLGYQRSFLNIMREFIDIRGAAVQPDLHATSFVIASPKARQIIESTYDAQHTYIGPGSMTDEWWNQAITTGLISIGNHSWDHVHPALPVVGRSKQSSGDFGQVDSDNEADAEIAAACAFIAERTGARQAPFFAYPFGQHNAFLSENYFPANGNRLGLRAAFTTEPMPITGRENIWCLPRYVCGHHWTSPLQLRDILASASR